MTRTLKSWFTFGFALLCCVAPSAAAPLFGDPPANPERVAGTTPISDINANGSLIFGPGASPLEFTNVTIEGTVEVGTGVLDPLDNAMPSTWFYVSDATGTVALVEADSTDFEFTAGALIRVEDALVVTQGDVPIRGTRTLDLSGSAVSITLLGTGTPTTPSVVTLGAINSSGANLEGSRVRVNGVQVVAGEPWPAAGSSAFVRVTDGTDTTLVYIDDETDLDGIVAPSAPFDLVAFVGQNDTDSKPSPLFDDLHYLYPTGTSDFIAGDGSGIVAVDPQLVVVSETGVALTFSLTGQEATIETFEVVLPVEWTWDANVSNLMISGSGFSGATTSFRSEGGTSVVVVSGAAVTSSDSGSLTIQALDAPSVAGVYPFVTRTATAGGTPAATAVTPEVRVLSDAAPGAVVINEVFATPGVSAAAAGAEDSEFVELFNPQGMGLDISGWTLTDIGRSPECVPDSRWAFPNGTVIPALGYLVVCRTALDPTAAGGGVGFLLDFPAFPPDPSVALFEMFDPEGVAGSGDFDDPTTPNMILLDPTSGDDQMALLGGGATNGGQCETVRGRRLPFAELVVLRDFVGTVIDLIEYREPGPCTVDLCQEMTAPDDAYFLGAPAEDASLGRNATSDDTDNSSQDLLPSDIPTPGFANTPGDSRAPQLVSSSIAVSDVVLDLVFDEVMGPTAADVSNYDLRVVATDEPLEVLDVIVDVNRGGRVDVGGSVNDVGRHFALVTQPLPPSEPLALTISGLSDLEFAGIGGNELDTTITFTLASSSTRVCDIQAFDEDGFSPLNTQNVQITGYVTLGDIPAVAPGQIPENDRLSIWIQEPNGCGVNVFAFFPDDPVEFETEFGQIREFGVQINDLVQVSGNVTEFVSGSGSGAVTEIVVDSGSYRLLLSALQGPEPIVTTTREAGDEAFEGTLLETEGTVINANSLAAYIDDGTGSIQVFQNFSALDLTRYRVGDRLRVRGIITQFDSTVPYLSGYELVPQNQEAITLITDGFARGGPVLQVNRRVLVPSLGERIRIETVSPARSDMIVEIFDSVGRKVTTLYDGIGLGSVTFEWDGMGQDGSLVKPGVYICHIRTVALDGGSVETETSPIVVGLPQR